MMLAMNPVACRASISRTILCTILLSSFLAGQSLSKAWDSSGAAQAFQEASRMRSNISRSPQPALSLYLECAKAYREVHIKDPHYTHTPEAIYQEGFLYQEMGDRFASLDFYKTAAMRFQLLINQYPGNQNCPLALLRLGNILEQNIKDEIAAQEAFQTLKTRYKFSAAARQLAATRTSPKAAAPAPAQAELPHALSQGSLATVQSVRHSTTQQYTRIVIDLDANAGYKRERLFNPERVYFDIPNAKLGKGLSAQSLTVEDPRLRQIRIAVKSPDTVRIVLDLGATKDYSVSELSNPFRIVVDLFGHEEAAARSKEPAAQTPIAPASAVSAAKTIQARPKAPPKAITELTSVPAKENTAMHPSLAGAEVKSQPIVETPGAQKPKEPAAKEEPAKADAALKPIPSNSPKAAMRTSRGDSTLTRMLGLKIGRIVIDPGHGGHDLGTIGPGGLYEKDLVLSIARELQELLMQRMGAEVSLTRTSDIFLSLEERTAIANQHRADLFVSIHANSSRIRSTSGVETYYLNFAKTGAEREIAARENASAASSIHELEDLVKKIAQADKASESRELAFMVQKNLYSGSKRVIPSTQNRGVRSAPFIVLIGANMPSILVEVAFISNPGVEKLLKKEANQGHLVKALFSGIEDYMKTLGSELVQNRIPIK